MRVILISCFLLAACADNSKPTITYIPPENVKMCADKSPSGVVHISPCDPLKGDPK